MTVKNREASMSHETRIALLENTIGYIHETLERIETNTNARFNKIEGIMKETKHELKEEMKESRFEGRSHFRWTMGYLISFFLGTFSVITAFILKIVHFI